MEARLGQTDRYCNARSAAAGCCTHPVRCNDRELFLCQHVPIKLHHCACGKGPVVFSFHTVLSRVVAHAPAVRIAVPAMLSRPRTSVEDGQKVGSQPLACGLRRLLQVSCSRCFGALQRWSQAPWAGCTWDCIRQRDLEVERHRAAFCKCFLQNHALNQHLQQRAAAL